MKKRIELAGIPIDITTQLESLTAICDDYTTESEPEMLIETDEESIRNEYRKTILECAYEDIEYPGYSAEELENTAVYREIANRLPEYQAVVFHGSAVAVDGRAYVFTAPSGTGKTTHTNLWLKNIPGAYVVNGDKPILRIASACDLVGGDSNTKDSDSEQVFVCGTPWMGKEGMGCNAIVPLSAIVFLKRGENNSIREMTFSECMPDMIGQTYRPQEPVALTKTLKVIENIGKRIKFYELTCNMDDEAAFVAYNYIKVDKILNCFFD